ncbi:hypothetical protein PSEUBRA_001889 [Kalmanozyma brasiliensis GHG001]|uniref:uncharacterized protein n=1 Tax=Kalmanozyma brasiliensis (strain GHG001) TaxID=1365824 RepID=UPI002867E19F|nr:uncharacterized protein PSEUBRA_001889 [Kalmanozyma brasiliensis GHG001]KAF6767012.1 hypothetical protein PSEUBRA_001889 [Kalmanozyma brasiliensis GHG001]
MTIWDKIKFVFGLASATEGPAISGRLDFDEIKAAIGIDFAESEGPGRPVFQPILADGTAFCVPARARPSAMHFIGSEMESYERMFDAMAATWGNLMVVPWSTQIEDKLRGLFPFLSRLLLTEEQMVRSGRKGFPGYDQITIDGIKHFYCKRALLSTGLAGGLSPEVEKAMIFFMLSHKLAGPNPDNAVMLKVYKACGEVLGAALKRQAKFAETWRLSSVERLWLSPLLDRSYDFLDTRYW